MSKKKRENIVEKMFDKKADILTKDNTAYRIRKIRIYNCETNYYGKVCAITSDKYNKKNLHIIREFYQTEDTDRIHVRLCRLTNVKMTKTIEKLPDGKERKILVINNYDTSDEFVHSIGPIKSFKSDKINEEKNNINIDNIKILKLILARKEESNKKVA
jgi:hypothetical protein